MYVNMLRLASICPSWVMKPWTLVSPHVVCVVTPASPRKVAESMTYTA